MKQQNLLYAIIFFLFFVIVLLPVFTMFAGSIWVEGRISFENYANLLLDQRQIALMQNSLWLCLGTTFCCLVLGVPLAFLASRTNLWGRKILGLIYVLPVLIPPYIHAIVWTHLLSKNGFLNHSLMALLALEEPPFNIHGLGGAIFVMTLAYFPFVTLMTASGLRSLDRGVEEASLLRHGAWRTIKGITLPLIAPHILCGALFVFVFSALNVGVPDILRVHVYPLEIFIQFSAYHNAKAAVALALPLVVATLFMVLLQKRYMKDRPYLSLAAGFDQARPYDLDGLKTGAFTFCVVWVFLSVVTPVVTLLVIAGPLSTYMKVLETSKEQIWYSVSVAAAAASLMLLFAFFVSYFIERAPGRGKGLAEFATLIPFAIPATALGIGMIKVWNRPLTEFIYGSSLIIILGYVAHFIPFATRVTISSLKQVNPRLEEAAALVTSNGFGLLGKVILPLVKPGLLVGFFVGFVLSLGDLGTTLLITPPGKSTVPVKIYNLMHYGAEHMLAALSLLMIGLITMFSGGFYLAYRKLGRGF